MSILNITNYPSLSKIKRGGVGRASMTRLVYMRVGKGAAKLFEIHTGWDKSLVIFWIAVILQTLHEFWIIGWIGNQVVAIQKKTYFQWPCTWPSWVSKLYLFKCSNHWHISNLKVVQHLLISGFNVVSVSFDMLANLQEFIPPMGAALPNALQGSQTLVHEKRSRSQNAEICMKYDAWHVIGVVHTVCHLVHKPLQRFIHPHYICIHYIWEKRSKVLKSSCLLAWQESQFLWRHTHHHMLWIERNGWIHTVTEMVDMVFAFSQSGGSYAAAVAAYQNKFQNCRHPSLSVLRRIIKRFLETGSVQQGNRSGRPRTTTDDNAKITVLAAVVSNPHTIKQCKYCTWLRIQQTFCATGTPQSLISPFPSSPEWLLLQCASRVPELVVVLHRWWSRVCEKHILVRWKPIFPWWCCEHS